MVGVALFSYPHGASDIPSHARRDCSPRRARAAALLMAVEARYAMSRLRPISIAVPLLIACGEGGDPTPAAETGDLATTTAGTSTTVDPSDADASSDSTGMPVDPN